MAILPDSRKHSNVSKKKSFAVSAGQMENGPNPDRTAIPPLEGELRGLFQESNPAKLRLIPNII